MDTSSNKFSSEIKQLYSQQEKEVIEALIKLRNSGDEEIMDALIDVLVATQSKEVYDEICKILYDLKNQESVKIIIDSLQLEKTQNHRHILISALWQSSIKSEEYLKELVDAAIVNDFITCLECLTVIENMVKPAEEDVIYGLRKLDQEISKKSTEKTSLLIELKAILENFLLG